MKRILLISVILLRFVFANAQLSGTYEVGSTQTAPFNTVKGAVTELNTVGISGAVTFLLTDPLYEESGIELKNIQGTSTTNTITIRPANGVNTEIKGDGKFVFRIDNCSHITFEGKSPNNDGSLAITSTETNIASSVIDATQQLNTNTVMYNIHINNCNINASQPFFYVDNKLSNGVSIKDIMLDSLIFQNNTFTGGDKSIKIALNASFKSINIIGNEFNLAGGVDLFFHGTPNSICRIQNNIFKDIYLCYLGAGLNIIKFISSQSSLIINNNLFDGIKYNLLVAKNYFAVFELLAEDVLVYNNIIKSINFNKPIGIVSNFIVPSDVRLVFNYSKNLKFYYNTVYIPQGSENGFYIDKSTFTGFYLNWGQNVEVKNNIFALLQGNKSGSTISSTAQIYNFESENDINNLQSDHNIYFVANHTQNYFYSLGITNNYYSFNQWQTSYPTQDQNSYWEMPNVVSKDNLHLSADCNRGTPISQVPLDFEEFTRSTTTPDIGAYEFLLKIVCENKACLLNEIVFEFSSLSTIQYVLWDFGDGTTSTEQNPTHEYATRGTYTVTLTVTYTNSTTQTITKDIEISEKPQKPIIEHE